MDKYKFFERVIDHLAQNYPKIYLDIIDELITREEMEEYFSIESGIDENSEVHAEAREFLRKFGVEI